MSVYNVSIRQTSTVLGLRGRIALSPDWQKDSIKKTKNKQIILEKTRVVK